MAGVDTELKLLVQVLSARYRNHRPGPINSFCSSGSHAAGQSVTWTGMLNSKHDVLGVKVTW